MQLRLRELEADEQRLDAARAEEDERGPEVEEADPLVVDRGQPAEEPGPLRPDAVEPVERGGRLRGGCDDRGQRSDSRYATRSSSWCCVSGSAGMLVPGLSDCGSRIHA